ncbi:carbon-nitrogen hydrolase [Lasiosphaeria miniovina]|uniref:Carbon-nitrogen hydrolase n=1 Tax=Lasiosphaeria miniovina TaxID=1954250 RepID=A0AA39ZYG9_9PEZI|nr:carbon-nitrogen hydrolase [Lasiosphaeria miniovina]KAK0705977.1 carbon-nitrogen hydrolase [Lasiosphaeria miniovina]
MAPPARIRLGAASPGTAATTAETLAQLAQITRRAAVKGIDVLLLPEAYIGGYPSGTAFGCVMGSRSREGRDEYLRYFQSAVDLGDSVGEGGAGAGAAWLRRELGGPGDATPPRASLDGSPDAKTRGDGTREQLELIARQTGVLVVTGCIEKAGGSMYCAVVYVCPRLGVIGKRRKVMPTGTERLVWAQGSPATLRAVTTIIRGVRINLAAAICWENYMPLVRQSLYAQNINLYLAPTADGRDTWLPLMRTAAIEGRCFVVTANMCVRKPTATHPAANVTHDSSNGDAVDELPDPDHFGSGNRRSSCVTEEGFEIALPSPPPPPPPPQQQQQQPRRPASQTKRRQSVFDEDGNEIVLCGDGPKAQRLSVANGHQPAASASSDTKFVSRGGSAIVSPFGEVLAGPQWEDDEGIIYADVDFDDCIRGRLDLDTAGSYSRNDSFKFSVEGLDLTPLPY